MAPGFLTAPATEDAPVSLGFTGEVTSPLVEDVFPPPDTLLEELVVEETDGRDRCAEAAALDTEAGFARAVVAVVTVGGIEETRRWALTEGGLFSGVPGVAARAVAAVVVLFIPVVGVEEVLEADSLPAAEGVLRTGAAARPDLDGGFCKLAVRDVAVFRLELAAVVADGRVLVVAGRLAAPLTTGFRDVGFTGEAVAALGGR